MEQRDNIHHNWREIDGYNKMICICAGPREPGKTDSMWFEKIFLPWLKDKRPWVYFVRQNGEITEGMMNTILQTHINKWIPQPIEFYYRVGDFKNGIVDVYIVNKTTKENELFFRVVSLAKDIRILKNLLLPRIKNTFMDEYIINPIYHEKYADGEAMKIIEALQTWKREKKDGVLRLYVATNIYSLYCPLFVYLKINPNELSALIRTGKNGFMVGKIYALQFVVPCEELRKKLLEENPLYEFDEEYKKFAYFGLNVNDANIRTGEFPLNYSLRFVVRINNINIGIFQNNYYEDHEDRFYCKEVMGFSNDRTIFAFDFTNVVEHSILAGIDERRKLERFKTAFRKRQVVFSNINIYYLIEEVYFNL